MLLRQKPNNISQFVSVTDKNLFTTLHQHGYIPLYLYDGIYYFEKNIEIENFIKQYKVVR